MHRPGFLPWTLIHACDFMIQVALNDKVSLRAASKQMGIRPRSLEAIGLDLVRQGLLSGIRGRHGGYVLAKPAVLITLYDIYLATEAARERMVGSLQEHSISEAAAPAYLAILGAFTDTMKRITLADLMDAVCQRSGQAA